MYIKKDEIKKIIFVSCSMIHHISLFFASPPCWGDHGVWNEQEAHFPILRGCRQIVSAHYCTLHANAECDAQIDSLSILLSTAAKIDTQRKKILTLGASHCLRTWKNIHSGGWCFLNFHICSGVLNKPYLFLLTPSICTCSLSAGAPCHWQENRFL